MTKLYDEALLEARQLRQAAENNATRTVVEAITPRIRELIEKQILGEDVDEEMDILGGAVGDITGDMTVVEPEGGTTGDMPMPTDGTVTLSLDSLSESDDDDEDDMTESDGDNDTDTGSDSDDTLLLNMESAKALMTLKESVTPKTKLDFNNRVKRIQNSLGFGDTLLESHLGRDKKSLSLLGRLCDKMLNEMRILSGGAIGIAGESSKELEKLRKEITEMATRKRLTEMDLMMEFGMTEDDEEIGLDDGEDFDVELEDEEEGEEEVEEESEAGATLQITGLPAGVDVSDLDLELVGDDGEDFDIGDEDLEMTDDAETGDEEMDFSDMGDDEVVDIDESMLRRELLRMRKIAEGNADDPKCLAAFGGAKKDREPFVDSDDSDLNKQDGVGTVKVEGKTLKRLRNESRQNRALRKERADLRKKINVLTKQLQEQNLFNAKLLYVNRLVHTKSLNEKQLRSIVGSLDKAQSLREVKLLYKGFTESLNRRGKSKSLTETAHRSTGGSSRSAGRGGSSNASSNVTVDRWAQLAGLPDKA